LDSLEHASLHQLRRGLTNRRSAEPEHLLRLPLGRDLVAAPELARANALQQDRLALIVQRNGIAPIDVFS